MQNIIKHSKKLYALPKTILIIAPDRWEACNVSKHHYARSLATAGHQVYYLAPYRGGASYCWQLTPHLHVLHVRPRYRGLSYLPKTWACRLMRKEWTRLETLVETTFEMIWSFDSSRFFYLDALPAIPKIVQIMDLTENFQLDKLCQSADICLGGSKPICAGMRAYNAGVFYIGHGYSDQRVGGSSPVLLQEIADIRSRFLHGVGYVGNLEIPYIDWPLLLRTVERHPAAGFFFFGPYGTQTTAAAYIQQMKKVGNAFFFGAQPAEALHECLDSMDVLMIAYLAHKYREQLAHPHKVLEYLSTGKMILATWTADYADKSDLIYMVEDSQQFPERLKTLLDNKHAHNTPEQQIHRKAYADNHSYDKQLRRIAAFLAGNPLHSAGHVAAKPKVLHV